MLEDMEPDEFEERWAHYRIQPWDAWEVWFARLLAMMHNISVNLMSALTLSTPDEGMYKNELDFIPGAKPEKQTKRRLTAEEAEALDRARYRRG
jgi:hypothetical protein